MRRYIKNGLLITEMDKHEYKAKKAEQYQRFLFESDWRLWSRSQMELQDKKKPQ